jgi:uncharacterized membrane protein
VADHTAHTDDLVLELGDDGHPSAADRARRVQETWSRMGGKLGIGFCVAGFLLVFLGWNGAASTDRVSSQVPYLVSGGFAGLALVILGVGLLVVQSNRADRAALQATIRELRDALEAGAVAGASNGASATALTPGEVYRPARQRPTPPEVLAELDHPSPAETPPTKTTPARRRKAPITAE